MAFRTFSSITKPFEGNIYTDLLDSGYPFSLPLTIALTSAQKSDFSAKFAYKSPSFARFQYSPPGIKLQGKVNTNSELNLQATLNPVDQTNIKLDGKAYINATNDQRFGDLELSYYKDSVSGKLGIHRDTTLKLELVKAQNHVAGGVQLGYNLLSH